jgi:hypothetical protein
MHYSIMGKITLPFIDSDLFYIEVPFKAGLTVDFYCDMVITG